MTFTEVKFLRLNHVADGSATISVRRTDRFTVTSSFAWPYRLITNEKPIQCSFQLFYQTHSFKFILHLVGFLKIDSILVTNNLNKSLFSGQIYEFLISQKNSRLRS